ncbi:unnamed protein product, partial [Ectocarpus fasciculatus]
AAWVLLPHHSRRATTTLPRECIPSLFVAVLQAVRCAVPLRKTNPRQRGDSHAVSVPSRCYKVPQKNPRQSGAASLYNTHAGASCCLVDRTSGVLLSSFLSPFSSLRSRLALCREVLFGRMHTRPKDFQAPQGSPRTSYLFLLSSRRGSCAFLVL